MGGFVLSDFAGMVPQVSPRLLAPNQAQLALNTKLWSGEIRAFRDLSAVVTPSKVGTKKTIYRFGQDVVNEAQYWFHWLNDVDVVRGPVNNDASERTYWTGEAEPRVTDSSIALLGGGTDYPNNWYKLGIPKPAPAPSLATDGAGSGDEQSVAAVYTFVSAWGEEGPPSDPSTIETVKFGDTLTIGSMATSPGTGYNVASKRIYLAISGSSATDYQLFAEVPLATASTGQSYAAESLGEVIATKLWVPPPAGLIGLIGMDNGMMAGLLNNDVWFCEPFAPYAWPVRYRKSTKYGIVGLGSFDQTIVVCTKGVPSVGMGAHPANIVLQEAALRGACVSKRGIVSMPGGVAYPTADGLAWIGADGQRYATDGLFSRDEWAALVPSSFSAYRLGQRYVGFYDDGIAPRGFILSPGDPRSGLVYIDTYATAGYLDPLREQLYLQVGADIKRWDGAGAKAYTWKSKVFSMPRPMNPRFGQVKASSYPVTFKLYADGALKLTKTVQSAEAFALPGGYKARDFELQFEGTANILGAAVMETMADLKQVSEA